MPQVKYQLWVGGLTEAAVVAAQGTEVIAIFLIKVMPQNHTAIAQVDPEMK